MALSLLRRVLPARRAEQPARVSVAIPLYNHARYIEQALRSVTAQGAIVREVVVVDDGSQDDGAAAVLGLAQADDRIRLIRQNNQGAHAALARALAECGGELLAILNSDDAWLPGRLTALAAALDADPAAGFAVSGLEFMDAAGTPAKNDWQRAALRFHTEGAELGVALLNGNFVQTTSNLLVRRTCWEAVGPFAALRYAHDLDWMLRALALGQRMLRLDAPLMRYRMHSANTIGEDHRRVREEWAIVAGAWLTALWDRPGAPPIDWTQAAAVARVLRTHELDQAAALVMAYLRREGAPTLDRSALLDDAGFRATVAELCAS